jgi:hypothetical protein
MQEQMQILVLFVMTDLEQLVTVQLVKNSLLLWHKNVQHMNAEACY